MRRLFAIALIVMATAALLPGAIGLYLQYRFERLLDDLALAGYETVAAEYRLGWLLSQLTATVAPAGDPGMEQPRLRVSLRLEHGPRTWFDGDESEDLVRRWPPVLAKGNGRATIIGGHRQLPPVRLSGELGLFGELELRLSVPDLTYSGEVGRLRVGSGAAIVSNPDAGEWRFVGEIGTMEAEAPDGRRLRVSGINVAIALAPLGGVLPVNALTIEVGELLLDATASDPAFSLEGLAVQLTGVERDSTADLRVSAAVTSLALGGDGYAPSKLALTLAGIDVGGLRTLRSRLGALGARSLAPSQRGLATARLLQASLPELFSGEPLFALEQLEVTTPFGLLAAEADLALAAAPPSPVVSGRDAAATGTGSPGDDASLRLSDQTGWEPLRSLTRRLSGTGRWSAPQSLVVALVAGQQATRVRRELALRGEAAESLPPGLAAEVESASQSAVAGLLRDGWLTADQGRLATEFRVEGGAVQINGRPVAMTGWFADERGSR
jgi:hypothetical protein